MLPKAARLSAAEVREVLKKGRSARAGGVSARYTSAKAAKAAVVVSGKVAKTAVERNRLRRAGYAALGTLPPSTHLVLFIQKKDFTRVDIAHDIAKICSQLS